MSNNRARRPLYIVHDEAPNTTYVECGARTIVVSEHLHRGQVYLSATGAAFLEPAAALTVAAALIEAAGKAIETQFRRQLGSQ